MVDLTDLTELSDAVEPAGPEQGGQTRPPRPFRQLLRRPLALLAIALLVMFVALAVLAPVAAPFDPNQQDFSAINQAPSGDHRLGTDELGRDVLSRVIFGTRVSLVASVEAVAVALALGVPLGLLAGYVGGRTDGAISRVNDMLMSVPGLVLALTVVAVLGPGLTNAMLAIGVILAPLFFRIMRAATLDVRHQLFVESSVTIGCSRFRVMWAHVLPNAMPAVVVQASLALGGAVTAEAALSFLGLGVLPPTASWGSMLAAATQRLERTYLLWGPGGCLVLLVLAFTLLGDAINDALGGRRAGG